MMAEAHDTRAARRRRALDAAERDDGEFFPIKKLPNDLLVSVFSAVVEHAPSWRREAALLWVRHTIPRVCKEWSEIYRSRDASPLHETLVVDFRKEVQKAAAARKRERRNEEEDEDEDAYEYDDEEEEEDSEVEEDEDEEWGWKVEYVEEWEGAPRRPAGDASTVHASRVVAWAQRRAGSVRKLHLKMGFPGALDDFSARDLGALLAAVGPSLTEISIGPSIYRELKTPFWEALRTSVAPTGRLRSLTFWGIETDSVGSDLEPLGQLARSLEELVLINERHPPSSPLSRLPAPFFALTELRRLVLEGHPRITAIPAEISSLKKLEVLELEGCGLSSLPKELGELSGLTRLELEVDHENRGDTLPADEAFPAELRKLQSLRVLRLHGLLTVPEFIGNLQSLEVLDLSRCSLDTLPAFVGDLKSLKSLDLNLCGLSAVPAVVCKMKSLESLALGRNTLSSLPKELGGLSGLTRLYIDQNESLGFARRGGGLFPAELGKLKSLRDLSLYQCQLNSVPAFIGELESLRYLSLERNRIGALPTFLAKLRSLECLVLSRCENLSAVPAFLGRLTSLRALYLNECPLRAVPAALGKLKRLEYLSCGGGVDKERLRRECPRLRKIVHW